MKIYFVRHGETQYNRDRLFQGNIDIPLNETGLEQAAQTAEWFKKHEISFDKVFTSPLSRAVKTAEIVSGLNPEDVIVDERMRELSFGIMEGIYFYDMPLGVRKLFHEPENYEVPEKGETIDHLQARCQSFLDMLSELSLQEDAPETVLVAAHGGIFRGLISCITKSERKDFWVEGVPNCAILPVHTEEGRLIMEDIIAPIGDALGIALSKEAR